MLKKPHGNHCWHFFSIDKNKSPWDHSAVIHLNTTHHLSFWFSTHLSHIVFRGWSNVSASICLPRHSAAWLRMREGTESDAGRRLWAGSKQEVARSGRCWQALSHWKNTQRMGLEWRRNRSDQRRKHKNLPLTNKSSELMTDNVRTWLTNKTMMRSLFVYGLSYLIYFCFIHIFINIV